MKSKKLIGIVTLLFGILFTVYGGNVSINGRNTTANVDNVEVNTAAIAGKVDKDGGVVVRQVGATTNYVSRVLTNNVAGYTNGLVVITKVYNAKTNTFYDFTD